jgi:release factor glutamine methyltransferase
MASQLSMTEVTSALRAAGCVFAEDEAQLLIAAAQSAADLDTLVRRRCTGVPLEHLLGWVAFGGMRVVVEPAVFVPRRRSELLAAQAATYLGPRSVVVELCCGVAAISAVLLARQPDLELHAADVDPAAVACARRNIETRGGAVHCGDLYAPLPHQLAGRVDVLIANAPYVPTAEIAFMPPEARLHEPLVALDGGPDGLDIARRIVVGAARWLAPGGHLLIETSVEQAPTLAGAAERAGLHPQVVADDELGGTVVVATQ